MDIFIKKNKKEKELITFIRQITGYEPQNLSVYFLALKHASVSKEKKDLITHSNERLEYLGDAVLGAIIAEHLFKKFPFKDEGFLTEIRSRIVNGESLSQLARKIGLHKFVEYNARNRNSFGHKSMYGDAMEALVGAVFLDHGFKKCKTFVLEKLLDSFIDLDEIVNTDINYKSKLIMWGQSKNKKVIYEIIHEQDHKHYKEFTAHVMVDGTMLAKGNGSSKKKAEQDAARRALEIVEGKAEVPL